MTGSHSEEGTKESSSPSSLDLLAFVNFASNVTQGAETLLITLRYGSKIMKLSAEVDIVFDCRNRNYDSYAL